MPDNILRIARRVRSAVRNARQHPVTDCVHIEKQSADPSIFAPLLARLGDVSRTEPLSEIRSILERQQELRSSLAGEIHETSFRHKIQKMDAAEVLASVSSPSVGLDLIFLAAQFAPPGWRTELGSAFGIGTLALCLAEQNTQNPIDGVEFEAWRADIATEGAQRVLGDRVTVHAGAIEDVLPMLAPSRPRIGFSFIDAMHTHEATFGYHKLIEQHATPGGLALYDDLAWSSQMEHAWKDIVASPSVTDAVRIDRRWGLARYVGMPDIQSEPDR
jgi:predicted O-methyltransferase YrrM